MSLDNFNKQGALRAMKNNNIVYGSSHGTCAKSVRLFLESGGINTAGHPVAASGYLTYLPKIGFNAITTISGKKNQADWSKNHAQVGDIAVMKHGKYGHICMWDGKQWVSDFKQKNANPYKEDVEITIFRHNGVAPEEKETPSGFNFDWGAFDFSGNGKNQFNPFDYNLWQENGSKTDLPIFSKRGSKLIKKKTNKYRINKSDGGDNTEEYKSKDSGEGEQTNTFSQQYDEMGHHILNFKGLPFYYRWLAHLMDMAYAQRFSNVAGTFSHPSNYNVAQSTYLYPTRKMQELMFYRQGYKKGEEGDYGLVRTATEKQGKNIPVYQRNEDEITREKLNVMDGNPMYIGMERFLMNPQDEALEHAGIYPSRVYVDPTTQDLYVKSWDLNDYGGAGDKTGGYYQIVDDWWKKQAADILDVLGKPVVVTTGFRRMYTPLDRWQVRNDPYEYREPLNLNNIIRLMNDPSTSEYFSREWNPILQNYIKNHFDLNLEGSYPEYMVVSSVEPIIYPDNTNTTEEKTNNQ